MCPTSSSHALDVLYVQWKGSSEALAKDVRPVFLALIPLAMERKISVAIVTFSRKVDMIRSVLRVCFPDLADSIPVRGCDDTSKLAPVCNQLGKQSHMALAVEWLTEKSPTLEISRNSTLLIDDDSKNVRAALKEKVRAILFNPQDLDRYLLDTAGFVYVLLSLLSHHPSYLFPFSIT
jgi:hypothetical protein